MFLFINLLEFTDNFPKSYAESSVNGQNIAEPRSLKFTKFNKKKILASLPGLLTRWMVGALVNGKQ